MLDIESTPWIHIVSVKPAEERDAKEAKQIGKAERHASWLRLVGLEILFDVNVSAIRRFREWQDAGDRVIDPVKFVTVLRDVHKKGDIYVNKFGTN